MHEENKMPEKGIKNRIMTAGPWEPTWFESYNQKFMPNNTEFVYYDYPQMDQQVAQISKEMEQLGVKGAERAYNLLRPYAFKKDLFQWMALWKNGGIFMDAKVGFNHSVADWIDFSQDEFLMCADPEMITDNMFTAMTKYHPYGLMMVQHIVDQVNDRAYYNAQDSSNHIYNLNITGPDSIRQEFVNTHQLTWSNVRCYKQFEPKTKSYITYLINHKTDDDRTVLMLNDPVKGQEVWKQMTKCEHCNSYKELFKNRQVYCDQPGPTKGCGGHDFKYF